MAQWLSTLHTDIGFGRARSKVSELFQNKFYEQIFGDFDKELKSYNYRELARVTWAGLFVKNLLRNIPSKKKVFAKISHLLLVRLVTEAIREREELSRTMDEMLSQHRFGRDHIPNQLIQPIKNIVTKF